MSKAIIDSIRDYIMQCPLLHNGVLNIDYLPEEVAYSIDSMQADPYYKKYVDGGGIRQKYFAITSKELFGDLIANIENSSFCQGFEEWIHDNNESGVLPVLEGYKAQRIDVTYSGAFLYADVGAGVYQVQCRLLYE